MLGQKNKTYMVVGKDLAPLAETETREDLATGQIGIFKNGSNTAIDGTTDLAAGDRFKVVYKDVDGKILESPMYDYSLIQKKSAANYLASTEQKTYIAYNGTSGSINLSNNDVYHIHVIRKDWSKTWNEHGSFKLGGVYESDSDATQTEIADALFTNLVKNFAIERLKSGVTVTSVVRINSAAVTALNGLDNAATVTKGVSAISIATAVEYNSTAVAVGDYVRIGSVAGGTTLTSNVYKVTSIDSLVITLDAPVLEASGTYAAGTADIEVIPAATAKAADWGLMLQSEPVKFIPGLFKFQNVTFEVTLSAAFAGTPVTKATKPTKGIGTYQDVAEMEWETRNVMREAYHVASYPVSENLNATLGKTYDLITIELVNDNARAINQKDLSFMSLVIATENESTGTVHTDLKDIFNIS